MREKRDPQFTIGSVILHAFRAGAKEQLNKCFQKFPKKQPFCLDNFSRAWYAGMKQHFKKEISKSRTSSLKEFPAPSKLRKGLCSFQVLGENLGQVSRWFLDL